MARSLLHRIAGLGRLANQRRSVDTDAAHEKLDDREDVTCDPDEFGGVLTLEMRRAGDRGWTARILDDAVAEAAVREGVAVKLDGLIFKGVSIVIQGDFSFSGSVSSHAPTSPQAA